MSLQKLVNHLPDKARALLDKRASLKKEIATLKRRGYTLAKPHWRGGRQQYLYLVHPMVDGERRNHEYIGADDKSQKDALDRVERGKRYVLLTNALAVMERQIALIKDLALQMDRALTASLNGDI